MKSFLFFAVLLTGLTTVGASEINSENSNGILDITRYHNAQPISFVERGVEFIVFPDGSFDFNTEIGPFGDLYYRGTTSNKTRRSSVNNTHGAPGQNQYGGGVLITHDTSGKVRRIGNVFINYDREGRIKRAGSVYMTYNRGNGMLTQVGNLKVRYNAWGEVVNLYGHVNQESLFMNGAVSEGYTQTSGYPTGYYTNTHSQDNYYYKESKKD